MCSRPRDAVERGCRGRRTARGLRAHAAALRQGHPAGIGMDFGVDVGATFLIVALGKRSPMPYVWLPRGGAGLVPERQGAFGALRCSARMVEVPNPAKFLG